MVIFSVLWIHLWTQLEKNTLKSCSKGTFWKTLQGFPYVTYFLFVFIQQVWNQPNRFFTVMKAWGWICFVLNWQLQIRIWLLLNFTLLSKIIFNLHHIFTCEYKLVITPLQNRYTYLKKVSDNHIMIMTWLTDQERWPDYRTIVIMKL